MKLIKTYVCFLSFHFQECPSLALDLQFLIHASVPSSPGDNDGVLDVKKYDVFFTNALIKTWLKRMADSFFIGRHYTQVAVTICGESQREEISFDKLLSKGKI